jgi:uncharacterized protein (DUF885 family)
MKFIKLDFDERITKEIDALQINRVSGRESVFQSCIDRSLLFPFTTDEQILESYRASKIEPKLKNIFNIVPKTAFEVKAIENLGNICCKLPSW